MKKKLVKIKKPEQNFSLKALDQITAVQPVKYPLVPADYGSIDDSLKDAKQYEGEIEKQISYPKVYLDIRKFFRQKVFGKKVRSISELFDLQISTMGSINYGLNVINNEARHKLNLLERYVEKIHYEYEHNFLDIDNKRNYLNPLLQDYVKLYQEFSVLTKKDKNYFSVESSLRMLKRKLGEEGLDYKKTLDVIDDFEKERNSLNALEDFFRYSIHLSERMVGKAKRFESHVRNTKDAYIMAKNINCGFSVVLKSMQGSSNTISQLQQVLTDGLKDMADNVSDPNLPPYTEFEMLLKSRYDSVRTLVHQNDQNKENLIDMEKKGNLDKFVLLE